MASAKELVELVAFASSVAVHIFLRPRNRERKRERKRNKTPTQIRVGPSCDENTVFELERNRVGFQISDME